jgi:replication factor C large subunit
MAAAYDLDEAGVAFVTGSGESTNKVASIVADARERREEVMSEHAGQAFVPGPAREDDETTVAADDTDATAEDDVESDTDEDGETDDGQSGLSDFM